MNTNTDGYFTTLMSRYSWRSLPRVFAYIVIYALTIGLASLLWQRPVVTLTYVQMSALLLWLYHAFSDLLYFALPAILDPIGEFVAVGFGAWEYSLRLLNIPVWLPLAWGISGLCLKKSQTFLWRHRQAQRVTTRWSEPGHRILRSASSLAGPLSSQPLCAADHKPIH